MFLPPRRLARVGIADGGLLKQILYLYSRQGESSPRITGIHIITVESYGHCTRHTKTFSGMHVYYVVVERR